VASLDTPLQSTVEEGVEHGVGLGLNVIVGLDVLLQALSAVDKMLALVLSHPKSESRWLHAPDAGHETRPRPSPTKMENALTWIHCGP
jgi:hypothetical protein